MRDRRVLYIQYTDPAAYPPLEHSAHILADTGWDVRFVAIESYGARGMKLRPHERISIAHIGGRSGGPGGLLKYAAFAARTARLAQRLRPAWIYASDALAAPAALLAAKLSGARVVYHEHDVPARASGTTHGMMMRARDRLIDFGSDFGPRDSDRGFKAGNVEALEIETAGLEADCSFDGRKEPDITPVLLLVATREERLKFLPIDLIASDINLDVQNFSCCSKLP